MAARHRDGSLQAVLHSGRGVYLALRAHITAATFDPAAEDGGGNALYRKIFASIETNRARIQFQFAGKPPSDASIIMVYINDDLRELTFPLNWAGSAAHLEFACTADIAWTVEYAGDVIGTIAFAPGTCSMAAPANTGRSAAPARAARRSRTSNC